MECSSLPTPVAPLRGATGPPHVVGRPGEARQAAEEAVAGTWGATLKRLPPACCWAEGLNRIKTWATTCCVPGAFIPLYMGSVKPLQVFAGLSDLGGQLGVLLFVDQVLQLPWIFDADAQQPPRAIRLGVDDIRVIERLGVDLDDLAADRRLDRRRRLLGFHVPHAPLGVQHVPE